MLAADQFDAPFASPRAQLDVCVAEHVFQAIGNDALFFHFQPVFDSSDMRRIPYLECLTRVRVGDDGHIAMAGDFIPTLEQAGLMRPLDRYNVKRAVEILKMEPTVSLGVNISAQSTTEDIWWGSTMLELQARPDIAERLVVEITETAPVIQKSSRSFSKRMQALGCRIAIDDFGVGHSIETAIEINAPDLIKIDKKYIASARSKKSEVSQLLGMVNLAKGIGKDVVIEGVENPGDLEVARRVGVNWVQGYYLSEPSMRVMHSRLPMRD
ncbi:EAL domain-containing protein [Cupriavidus sp. H39]|uniref:EAL domain-containing protein n=1 Tax=Cupriavidus sp. H39 TaxID=3401635 RepID=UPI003CFE7E73